MILSIHSSLGYVPQFYQQYPHPGYPSYQYPPQQGYYYGQLAPTLPPAGSLYHASIPPQQHPHGPVMKGPTYQGNLFLCYHKLSEHLCLKLVVWLYFAPKPSSASV